ncbi:ADP-ribosylglycohydrolase family protein [Rubellicoccus peritrichatus]|uniref:ADP-ribosylglycohydrolase family protein n=1 Tax=Rubellicoccus peritrichatus TaxID=3080537 RepID=A0AAQ3LF55_9BACT|nr:ADP-ribosylglycohydrolase family protein [Puniceicoccus sp. CR14]WOO43434.1 ADP-ribosylglycohydrolase family protein [Puniceicoccus sp. CR14]
MAVLNQKLISIETYLDRVRGMWVGKFIGGTLGAPIEGIKDRHSFTPGDLRPELAENDDTDLQILWLHALEEHGPGLTSDDMIREWLEHYPAPWAEYGVMRANWQSGLKPPETGRHNNWFYHAGMGCPIRSEIWGAVCPGAPELAAKYAEQDGVLDHTGDAVEAEKFLAAMDASIFVEDDLSRLLDIGQSVVDPESEFYDLVVTVRQWAVEYDWETCRRRILNRFGHPEMTHVLQNLGFVILGLIQGEGDFESTICKAINCGYDSDCTAASAGAIIGGLLGFSGLPSHLRDAVPGEYQLSKFMVGFPREGSLDALCNSCGYWAQKVIAYHQSDIELEGEYSHEPIAVEAQKLPSVLADQPDHPNWSLVGPFFRPWDERFQQNEKYPDHGLATMPSIAYFAHNDSGIDTDYLDGEGAFDLAALLALPCDLKHTEKALDDRLPLGSLDTSLDRPWVGYAYTEFELPESIDLWLMFGSSGPFRVFLDGKCVLKSDSYQPLTPVSFAVEQRFVKGDHRLLIKFASTSNQPVLYFALKEHDGMHWHQKPFYLKTIWKNDF